VRILLQRGSDNRGGGARGRGRVGDAGEERERGGGTWQHIKGPRCGLPCQSVASWLFQISRDTREATGAQNGFLSIFLNKSNRVSES
jgi:hypothetical protein